MKHGFIKLYKKCNSLSTMHFFLFYLMSILAESTESASNTSSANSSVTSASSTKPASSKKSEQGKTSTVTVTVTAKCKSESSTSDKKTSSKTTQVVDYICATCSDKIEKTPDCVSNSCECKCTNGSSMCIKNESSNKPCPNVPMSDVPCACKNPDGSFDPNAYYNTKDLPSNGIAAAGLAEKADSEKSILN